jgi:TPR repeat protein
MYMLGKDIPQDKAAAERLLRKAADQGSISAKVMLATLATAK